MKNLWIALCFSTAVLGCQDASIDNEISENLDIKNIQEIKRLEFDAGNEDITLLSSIVGDAELVCLGESRHDIHEQFRLKARFVKYLVEELGFTTLALEASLPYSNSLNNYILNGEGDLGEIMANMPGWFLWDTKEMQELFNWLRDHNQNTTSKVNFYGIDIVAPNNGMSQIFEYISQVDPAYYEQLKDNDFGRALINDNYWPSSLQQFAGVSDERKGIITRNYNAMYQAIASNRTEYERLSSKVEYNWILTLAYAAKEAIHMFSAEDDIEIGLIRDRAMAYLSSWIQKQNGKTIIWAHNVHIAKSEFILSTFPDTKIKGMGSLLFDEFQDKIISIGASFGSGEFEDEGRIFESANEGSIDGLLSTAGLMYFLYDMTTETINKWPWEEHSLRGQEFEMKSVPIESFDAFFYIDSISKVQYNPQRRNRLNH